MEPMLYLASSLRSDTYRTATWVICPAFWVSVIFSRYLPAVATHSAEGVQGDSEEIESSVGGLTFGLWMFSLAAGYFVDGLGAAQFAIALQLESLRAKSSLEAAE